LNSLVCGSDGRIYENGCVFEKEQCVQTSLTKVKDCPMDFCQLV
jgi:hypothetical protein